MIMIKLKFGQSLNKYGESLSKCLFYQISAFTFISGFDNCVVTSLLCSCTDVKAAVSMRPLKNGLMLSGCTPIGKLTVFWVDGSTNTKILEHKGKHNGFGFEYQRETTTIHGERSRGRGLLAED